MEPSTTLLAVHVNAHSDGDSEAETGSGGDERGTAWVSISPCPFYAQSGGQVYLSLMVSISVPPLFSYHATSSCYDTMLIVTRLATRVGCHCSQVLLPLPVGSLFSTLSNRMKVRNTSQSTACRNVFLRVATGYGCTGGIALLVEGATSVLQRLQVLG